MIESCDLDTVSSSVSPICIQASLYQSLGSRINFSNMSMGCEREQHQTNLRMLIRFVLQLSVGEERMKNSKVGVTTLYAWDYQSGSNNCTSWILTASLSSGRSTNSRKKTSTNTRRSFV